ncbi:uncharacterized protein RBU47_010214 [Passerculus sandwichensis]
MGRCAGRPRSRCSPRLRGDPGRIHWITGITNGITTRILTGIPTGIITGITNGLAGIHRITSGLRGIPQITGTPRGAPCGAAGRMITKSLSRDPALPLPPPRRPPGTPPAPASPSPSPTAPADPAPRPPPAAPKRRRVTAEAEGKYVISLPKGTTARSRHILRLHAARGLGRPSVFERLGAEAKAAAAAGAKVRGGDPRGSGGIMEDPGGSGPRGVFSRLGAAPEGPDAAADPGAGDPADPEALPYAGVLKKRRECSGAAATAMAAQDGACVQLGGRGLGVRPGQQLLPQRLPQAGPETRLRDPPGIGWDPPGSTGTDSGNGDPGILMGF